MKRYFRPMDVVGNITIIATCIIACGVAEPYAKSFKDRIVAKHKLKKAQKDNKKKEDEENLWRRTADSIRINQMKVGS